MNKPVQTTLLDDAMAELSTSKPAEEPPPARQAPAPEKEAAPWSANDPDLVIVEQPATRAYLNPFGSVVITQEARDYGDDDRYVLVRPSNIPLLIEALQRFLPR